MKNMVRCITKDGSAFCCAIDATDLVRRIEEIHHTSAVVTAALGRLSIAASMMGSLLKNEQDSITLRMEGGGPAGKLLAVADSNGMVKSWVEHPVVELPLNEIGKLDVRGAIGTNGVLSVVKDIGLKEPFVGQIALVSGEVAEDITAYYATSEQIPTACGLGVLVNPDLTVNCAWGYLVQLLPFADEACIDRIEENLANIPPTATLIGEDQTPTELCMKMLDGLEPEVLDSFEAGYRCDCSKERVERALISIGAQELTEMIDEGNPITVDCQFCNTNYTFSPSDLAKLRDRCKK